MPANFDLLYRREREAIVRIAWSLTGSRTVAEELAQDAFLAAHRQWSQVAALDNPGAWVRRVAINNSLSVLRRRRVERRRLVDVAGQVGRDGVEPPDSTAEVWSALRRLSRRQMEVLVLVVVEDRSVAEVAEVLGCGKDTVRTHLRRGRLRLAELLGAVELEVDDDHP